MNRRSFLLATAVAPIAAMVSPVPAPAFQFSVSAMDADSIREFIRGLKVEPFSMTVRFGCDCASITEDDFGELVAEGLPCWAELEIGPEEEAESLRTGHFYKRVKQLHICDVLGPAKRRADEALRARMAEINDEFVRRKLRGGE